MHDCDWVTKLVGGTKVLMLKLQVAVFTPAGESATPIVQVTERGADPVLIDVGLNPKLVSDGAVMSSGDEVTVRLEAGMYGAAGKLPAWSMASTCGIQVPASAKRGIVSVHENVPLFRVPDAGADEPQAAVCSLSGAASWHEAIATPDFASVSAMLHTTVCDDAETLTLPGTRLNVPSAGATVSGSEVTLSMEGDGLKLSALPTVSTAVPLAVQTPDGEYRGTIIVHDHVPFARVPDDGEAALQLARWKKSGAVKVHVALATPAGVSVSVMLQVTVCDASVVSIDAGEKLNAVSAGGAVSHCASACGAFAMASRTTQIKTKLAGRRTFMAILRAAVPGVFAESFQAPIA